MKKEHWPIVLGAAAGAGVAAVAYSLLATSLPKGATAVQPFDINRYLGTWNEIARLPIRIEENLIHLTEEYSHGDDGAYKVVTRAYNTKKNEWKEATGKMKFAGDKNVGRLKVSYFGPFYLSYNVIALCPTYKYALVSGSGLSTLWILSKEASIPDDVKKQFLDIAAGVGFAVEKLEWF